MDPTVLGFWTLGKTMLAMKASEITRAFSLGFRVKGLGFRAFQAIHLVKAPNVVARSR